MDVFDVQSVRLPSNNITALALKGAGTLWVGTDNGLAILDAFNYGATIPKSSPLKGWTVKALAVEKSGKQWANSYTVNYGNGDMKETDLLAID